MSGFHPGRLLLFDTHPVRVPVVMLHSVVGFREDRPPSFPVWCPPPMFEGYLRYLARRGYHSVTLQALHDHLAAGASLPGKPIVLTFDDGYLDNWVYAAPLLRRYGFTATVFVPTDFVQPGETPRPTMDDVWSGRLAESDLEAFGYMNRGELRALAESGVLDVQSHGRSHTWLPVSEEILDFHHPGTPMRQLRWLWWNRHPERKPRWFTEIAPEGVPWGTPIYRNELALSGPAVEPDPGLERLLVAHVEAQGGRSFFERDSWRDELKALVASYRATHPPAAPPEDDASLRARLRGELAGSREALETITGRPARFLCWPNGGTCDTAFELLGETGYLAATLPSRARQPINRRGTDPSRIGRISATSFFRGTPRVFPWVLSFALKVERNRGIGWAEIPIKSIWLYRRIVPPSGGTPIGGEI